MRAIGGWLARVAGRLWRALGLPPIGENNRRGE